MVSNSQHSAGSTRTRQEQRNRLIKERVHCHLSALPFKLAYSLLKWLVMYCAYDINMIPYHDGAGYWVTPREMSSSENTVVPPEMMLSNTATPRPTSTLNNGPP